VLHDGLVGGVWRLGHDRNAGSATLVVTLAARLPKRAFAAVAAEGRRHLRFAASDAESHEVVLETGG